MTKIGHSGFLVLVTPQIVGHYEQSSKTLPSDFIFTQFLHRGSHIRNK